MKEAVFGGVMRVVCVLYMVPLAVLRGNLTLQECNDDSIQGYKDTGNQS